VRFQHDLRHVSSLLHHEGGLAPHPDWDGADLKPVPFTYYKSYKHKITAATEIAVKTIVQSCTNNLNTV